MRDDAKAQVVPVHQMVQFVNLEVTAVSLSMGLGRKLFCLSIYNKSCHNSVIGGDLNANNTLWGSKRTHARGMELGVRLLASAISSRPLTARFPDVFMVKDSINLSGIADGAINALTTLVPCSSDHLMLLLDCRLPMQRVTNSGEPRVNRARRLRKCAERMNVAKFQRLLHSKCNSFALVIEQFLDLREMSLTEGKIDKVTENFTDLITNCMEVAGPRKKACAEGEYIPAIIRGLGRWKTELVAALFRAYRRPLDDPVRKNWVALLREQVKSTRDQIIKEWRSAKFRDEMRNLDKLTETCFTEGLLQRDAPMLPIPEGGVRGVLRSRPK